MRKAAASPDGIFATRNILPAAAILAVTLIAYIPAMRAGFIWDDDSYITINEVLKSPDGLRRIWFEPKSTPQYYPIVFTALRIQYSLWQLEPAGYHVVNILLHALSAIILWRILSFLSVRGAWAVALIFAIHPVHVESVAWVTEIKNVLSGFFYLSAAWLALRFYLRGEDEKPRWQLWAGALLLFICALFSKTVTCSLPAAILLVLWWKRGKFRLPDILTLLPFFAVGAALALNTAMLERRQVGAVGAEWDFSFIERCLIAGRVLWFYAGKLLWPSPLIFIYPRWQIDASAAWQYIFPTAVIAVLAALWFLRGRIGRGPLAAALFFAMTLTPALGFFNVYPMRFSFVADHFQYLASIGIILLGVAAVTSWRAIRGKTALAVLTVVAVVFGTLTWRQCLIYRDIEVLWRDTLRKNPDAAIAWNNLGGHLYAKSFQTDTPEHIAAIIEEAIHCFSESIRLNFDAAQAHNNRGAAHMRLGRAELAIQDFNQAVELNPKLAEAYSNRGNYYMRTYQLEFALRDYDKALSLRPKMGDVYNLRAMIHYELKQYDKALEDVRSAQSYGVEPYPDFLGALYQALGVLPEQK